MILSAYETIRDALFYIPSDDRDLWVKMGMAIKSELGDAGFDLWDEWSRQDDSYNPSDARDVWKSIKADGQLKIGSLYFHARQHGYDGATPKPTTPKDQAAQQAEDKRKAADLTEQYNQTALRAQRLYNEASAATASSPYLQRKGIQPPAGVRRIDGLSSRSFGFESDWTFKGLIVPMIDQFGEIRSLQLIPDEAGRKKLFLKGAKSSGCFHVLGQVKGSRRVVIVEGLATGQSIHEATNITVVVAFSATNLPRVAACIRSKLAAAEIIIGADDDEAGRKAAHTAARNSNATVVFPGHGCNDFNDLHLAHGLKAVREAILGDEAEPVDDDEGIDWRADLIIKHRDDGSQVIPCRTHNLILILKHAPEFKGRIQYNEFSGRISIDRKDLDDVGPIVVKAAIERNWIAEKVPTGDVMDALSVVASQSPYHPVREYLESLEWDGIERIPSFFEDYCGCPRDDYHMAVARSLFVSAAARIFKPGCKVDTMVILESEQGMGKTKLWLTLFGEWCSEVTSSMGDKDFYAGLRGVWAADFSELDAFSKAETTQIKRILTSQSDSYRPHYGRSIQTFPRQCIFVGGTNRDDWNTDPTGARRFLPVRVLDKIDIDGVASNRDQLWAEAVVRFQRGEVWWEIPDAKKHQEEIYQGDPWEEPIREFLMGRDQVSVSQVLGDCLQIETGKQTRADQMRVAAALKRYGWERKQIAGGKWVYRQKQKGITNLQPHQPE